MRAPWVLVLPAAFAMGASCILPAASIGGTGGGVTTTTSTGTTTGPEGGGPVVPPQKAAQHSILTNGPAAVAPSGNPGQRHLIYVNGDWWMFHLVVGEIRARVLFAGDPAAGWQDRQGFVYDFGAPLDGRSFGVDYAHVNADIVHFSLSSANLANPLSHVRYAILGGTLMGASPDPVLGTSDLPMHAGDGTVTSIGAPPTRTVTDFTSIPSKACVSCAILALNVENGATWSFGTGI